MWGQGSVWTMSVDGPAGVMSVEGSAYTKAFSFKRPLSGTQGGLYRA